LVEQLRAAPDDVTVRDLVALFVVPLAGCLDGTPTWYLRFLTRVVESQAMADAPQLVRPEGLRYVNRELRRLLPEVSAGTFERRMRWVAEIALRALADLERESAAGTAPPVDEVVSDLLLTLEALLLAPDPAGVSG